LDLSRRRLAAQAFKSRRNGATPRIPAIALSKAIVPIYPRARYRALWSSPKIMRPSRSGRPTEISERTRWVRQSRSLAFAPAVWTQVWTDLRTVSPYQNSPRPRPRWVLVGIRARLPALHVLRSGSLARVCGVRFCNGAGAGREQVWPGVRGGLSGWVGGSKSRSKSRSRSTATSTSG